MITRRQIATRGGGEKRIQKQHEAGKLTDRERLELLFDPNSFVEIETLVESRCDDFGMENKRIPGDGVIVGYGMLMVV